MKNEVKSLVLIIWQGSRLCLLFFHLHVCPLRLSDCPRGALTSFPFRAPNQAAGDGSLPSLSPSLPAQVLCKLLHNLDQRIRLKRQRALRQYKGSGDSIAKDRAKVATGGQDGGRSRGRLRGQEGQSLRVLPPGPRWDLNFELLTCLSPTVPSGRRNTVKRKGCEQMSPKDPGSNIAYRSQTGLKVSHMVPQVGKLGLPCVAPQKLCHGEDF